MNISDIAVKTGIKPMNAFTDKEVAGVYISDMVSDIITSARPNCILITLQTHKSLIAAANLVSVAMIIVVKGRRPADDVIQLATNAGIGLFTCDQDTWSIARKLVDLGF